MLGAVFGTADFVCSGGFGVFTMPGAGYQPLHSDDGSGLDGRPDRSGLPSAGAPHYS